MKSVILCADDFAQNESISQGILSLIAQRRLSATSCMTNSPHWPEHSALLKSFSDQAAIGLHFNLTEGKPLGKMSRLAPLGHFPSLSILLKQSLLRKLDLAEIENELHHQLSQFEKYMGRLPDFIDGHQHIHQFPIIRDIVLKVYNERLKKNNSLIRSVSEKNFASLFRNTGKIKRSVIYLMGSSRFKNQLAHHDIRHNTSFSGVYDFEQSKNYSQLFPQFLEAIEPKGWIMCHPGLMSHDTMDSIAKSRYDEYCYFSSDLFLVDCQKKQIQIASRNQILHLVSPPLSGGGLGRG
jgi:predicted glycoside hydrolase/deacetylase ChbG (UPF0249 family)